MPKIGIRRAKLGTTKEGRSSKVGSKNRNGNGSCSKLGHVLVLPISQIKPSPENLKLYSPVNQDMALLELTQSIKEEGFKGALVLSRDLFILSGHRRREAARLAGLTALPCDIDENVTRLDESGHVRSDFLRHLETYNRQREKTFSEKLRESIVKADPEDSHRVLSEYRQRQARVSSDENMIELSETKHRSRISRAKQPFIDAIKRVFESLSEYLPLSDRLIHYELLNDPPLKHASKPASTYRNDAQSYKSLTELLTRMRLEGIIPFHWLADETRPVVISDVHQQVGQFLSREVDGLFKGYYRDLMQSQPNHIEIMYEKLTGRSFIEPIALGYCIPLTIGRGFSSLPPRVAMARRFRTSGKDKLIVIAMSDLDPDGDEITHSFARSMRDDFGIYDVECFKAALTMDQVREFRLPPNESKAKIKSTNWPKYRDKYGTKDVYELEALRPERQRALLEQEILKVLDVDAYNHEVSQEKSEAASLDEKRQTVLLAMGEDEK